MRQQQGSKLGNKYFAKNNSDLPVSVEVTMREGTQQLATNTP